MEVQTNSGNMDIEGDIQSVHIKGFELRENVFKGSLSSGDSPGTKQLTCQSDEYTIFTRNVIFTTDIAIGAPFEGDGSGVVYLYHGSSKGIELHYRQVKNVSSTVFKHFQKCRENKRTLEIKLIGL